VARLLIEAADLMIDITLLEEEIAPGQDLESLMRHLVGAPQNHMAHQEILDHPEALVVHQATLGLA